MIVPPTPIANVATAPPGSRPGMMALAISPTRVPKPTQTRMSLAHCCAAAGSCMSMTLARFLVRRRKKFPQPLTSKAHLQSATSS